MFAALAVIIRHWEDVLGRVVFYNGWTAPAGTVPSCEWLCWRATLLSEDGTEDERQRATDWWTGAQGAGSAFALDQEA